MGARKQWNEIISYILLNNLPTTLHKFKDTAILKKLLECFLTASINNNLQN